MRIKKTEKLVRICSTGHAEGDMLGQVYMYLAERKNSKHAQRYHRIHKKKLKDYTFLSKSEVAKMIAYGGGTPSPSVLKRALRKICALPGKGYSKLKGYISSLRKQKRNGN